MLLYYIFFKLHYINELVDKRENNLPVVVPVYKIILTVIFE